MSLPPLNPDRTVSGIAVDPRTLERVVPASRRPDGTLRKELKVRPGFTPQEDVSIFRGTRQQDAEERKQAKAQGHVPGWTPSSKPGSAVAAAKAGATTSKSAEKRAKKKGKKAAELEAKIKASWDDDDDDVPVAAKKSGKVASGDNVEESKEEAPKDGEVDELSKGIDQLEVKEP